MVLPGRDVICAQRGAEGDRRSDSRLLSCHLLEELDFSYYYFTLNLSHPPSSILVSILILKNFHRRS